MKKNTLFPILVVGLILAGLGVMRISSGSKPVSPDRPEIPKENQKDLDEDLNSVSTIIYGARGSSKSVVGAVNDSGKNNTAVTLLNNDTKFVYPLLNSKQMLYIDETNDFDLGNKIVIKNIIPDGGLSDGAEIVVYEAKGDYKIDRYVISENNEWISWYEIRPPFGTTPTHDSDYYKSYKANIKDIVNGASRSSISPIQLTDEKAEGGKPVNLPILITNEGKVYFDAMIPGTYALHTGFRDEVLNTILAMDTYNSTPLLFQQKYVLYSAFNPNNSRFPDDGDRDSSRPAVINTNIVKVFDLVRKTESIAAPGDEGEHYKNPVYVEGSPDSKLTIAAAVYKIETIGSEKKLVGKELQLITSSNGSFEKKTIAAFSDSKRQAILGVGSLSNGNKTLIVGTENGTLGNFGTGNGVAASGYRSMVDAITVYDLSELKKITTLTSLTSSPFEYLGNLPKTVDEKIGIERNTKIDEETLERTKKQLQLGTFVPVEPKRERRNPRSECETEWEKKGYPNYEACEACPVYIYSDNGIKDVSIRPLTPISESSSNIPLEDGIWNVKADENGRLFANGIEYKNIDFYFPRSAFEIPVEGWVIERNTQDQQITKIAKGLGFNEREIEDIVSYFRKNIQSNSFVLGILDDDQSRGILNFDIKPTPQSVKTILFSVSNLTDANSKIPTPNLPSFDREQYAVVTWGVVRK